MTPLHFNTLALHAGYNPKEHGHAGVPPIYQTAAYIYDDAEYPADLFDLKKFGYIYSRINNPTQDVLEKRITALEGGTAALAVASGQAAQFLAITTLCEAGDNFLASEQLYGGTYHQFSVSFKKFGIEVRFFDPAHPEEILKIADTKTKAIYVESIGNPSGFIPDFDALKILKEKLGVPLIVDNTLCTPALFRPLEVGADIVLYSASKYLGGHGNSIGGIIVDGGKFDFGASDKFPGFTKPSEGYHGIVFSEVFGKNFPLGNIAFAIKARVEGLRDFGPCISPFNAFLFLQGIETLSLRMDRHIENARKLSHFLETHPAVTQVFSAENKNSPLADRAKKYFPNGSTATFSFILKNGKSAGKHFVENVRVAVHENNLGDARTIVTHPASTTHRQLSEEEQVRCGITPGLIRVSTGIEDIRDIIADFEAALV